MLSIELSKIITHRIHSTYIKQTQAGEDKQNWNSLGHNVFSNKDAYGLISREDDTNVSNKNLTWIWKANTLNKLKFFLWLVCLNRLPTTHLLHRRKICSTDSCNICGKEAENVEHLFFRCNHSKHIWDLIHIRHNYPHYRNDPDTMALWLRDQLQSKKKFNDLLLWAEFIPFFLWQIWNNRNDIIFRDNTNTMVIDHAYNKALEFKFMTNKSTNHQIKRTIYIKWEPPDANFFKLNIAGACRGNPRKGGIGGVFRDSRKKWILGFNMGVHYATNIYMEILALLYGLKIALQENLQPLVIETDCKELISMLTNNSCSYQNIMDDCRYLLSEAVRASIKHIFREANGVADQLARNGCDLKVFGSLMMYPHPPAFVIPVFERDRIGAMSPRLIPLCNDS